MKQRIFRISLYITIPVFILYLIFLGFFIHSVEYFKPRTFEAVFKDPELLEHYAIGKKRNPGDYGYRYENVTFPSLKEDIRLHAWFTPAQKKSHKAIIMVHGRGANRLKPMKYLELFRKGGVDKEYNVFLPDLRNSGISPQARSVMGKKFAEDILGGMKFMKKNYGIDTFVLYSFSMGAMATMYLSGMPEFREMEKLDGIRIEKIIMDSPMVNAQKSLLHTSGSAGYPLWIIHVTLWGYNLYVEGSMEDLALSRLLLNVKIPVMILQGEKDNRTPANFLREEIGLLQGKKIQVHFFAEGEHVYLYPHPAHRTEYEKRVLSFLK